MKAWLFVLLLLPGGIADLIAEGRYEEAVAGAKSASELLEVAAAQTDPARVRGVVAQVVRRKGLFEKPEEGARWLIELSQARGGDAHALTNAGYLYLAAGRGAAAVAPLEEATKGGPPSGYALCYLGEAYRLAGRPRDAAQALLRAADAPRPPRRYLQQRAQAVAVALSAAGDRSYVSLLDRVGLTLLAARSLAQELPAGRLPDPALRTQALDLFARGLDDRALATDWWAAARLAQGDLRFRYLVEAVRRGEDPASETNHACPGAVLELAQECLKRGRLVAAAALARKRLRIGECEPAWDVLESVPPALASTVSG